MSENLTELREEYSRLLNVLNSGQATADQLRRLAKVRAQLKRMEKGMR
jgi:hypothetical protein